jgi:hypothetical protein
VRASALSLPERVAAAASAAAATCRKKTLCAPAGSRAAVCQAAATDTLELTEENVELVLDEVGRAARKRLMPARDVMRSLARPGPRRLCLPAWLPVLPALSWLSREQHHICGHPVRLSNWRWPPCVTSHRRCGPT